MIVKGKMIDKICRINAKNPLSFLLQISIEMRKCSSIRDDKKYAYKAKWIFIQKMIFDVCEKLCKTEHP